MRTVGAPQDYWAKLDGKPHEGGVVAWHPKFHHDIDVACVMRELLAQPTIARRLARAGGIQDLCPIQKERLVYTTALHDIGKLNAASQAQAVPIGERPHTPTYGHVNEATALLAPDALGPAFLDAFDAETLIGWFENDQEFVRMLLAAWSHHGRPVRMEVTGEGYDPRVAQAWTTWSYAEPREGLARQARMARKLCPKAFETGADPLPTTPRFLAMFAGLLMLADWIGSDRTRFPFSADTEEDRVPFATRQAKKAVREIGLDPERERAAVQRAGTDFAGAFGLDPRPAQEALADLPIEPGGSLAGIEAHTGDGKTEAALQHFRRLFAAGEVDSLYFALPTRSSGVEIHERVSKTFNAWFGDTAPQPVLAVPGYLKVGDQEGAPLGDFRYQWDDSVRPHTWAAENAKRYQTAFCAVGTIDQILLSILPAKHAHMRLAALSRSLVVIDEVHASDAYMSFLIETLCEQVRAAGGHVLLMSATLGAAARARFRGEPTPSQNEAAATPYPAVWTQERFIAPETNGPGKNVRIATMGAINDAARVAQTAVAAARKGARVLIIRNTVRAAVDTLQAVEAIDPALCMTCEGEPAVHHGRFQADDRKLLDKAIGHVVGKNAPRGTGVIVIGTQTLEQSLDIDADFLITDICPIDVLLQRLGRLHRKLDAWRPDGYHEAQALVLTPADRDLAPYLARPRDGLGRKDDRTQAYADLRTIEATWRILEDTPDISTPQDNRRLVERGTHPHALQAIADELGRAWLDHGAQIENAAMADQGTAGINADPFREHLYGTRRARSWDDRMAKTRLGDPDIHLQLDTPLPGPFGRAHTALTLPAWMMPLSDNDSFDPITATVTDDRLRVRGRTFRYDRYGLRPVA